MAMPQPVCRTLTRNPEWLTDGNVLSDLNFAAFMVFLSNYATLTEAQELAVLLPVVNHRHDDAQLRLMVGPVIIHETEPQTIHVESSTRIRTTSIQCTEMECSRCRNGTGGYMFRWVHPLWTPRLCVFQDAKGRTPTEIRHEVMAAEWPDGTLNRTTR